MKAEMLPNFCGSGFAVYCDRRNQGIHEVVSHPGDLEFRCHHESAPFVDTLFPMLHKTSRIIKLHFPVQRPIACPSRDKKVFCICVLIRIGNMSYHPGSIPDFDPQAMRFNNDQEANRMLRRDYRAPFVVPEKV